MNATTTTPRVFAFLIGGAALTAIGAAGMYWYLRGAGPVPAPAIATAPAAPSAPGEIAVTLAPEAVARAGIQTARPAMGRLDTPVVVPGIVEPNAYSQVVVRSVVAGQVRSVEVPLGAQVKAGDLLATVHSPELAETVREYLSVRSEFDAANQRLNRMEGLVKIGAASQQELEIARAEHTRYATDSDSARAKLIFLGLSPSRIASLAAGSELDSIVRITAPRDGLVTARTINEGANIDASIDLFTVVDTDSVWIVANVFERDLARLQVGSPATITTTSVDGRRWSGRVSYIDPQLASDTRTARVRVEVPNPGRLLRFGMYTDVVLSAAEPVTALLIERSAIQTVGKQSVVYIADPMRPGRFIERTVVVGATAGDRIEIVSGLTTADEVVVVGSFALRAERDQQ